MHRTGSRCLAIGFAVGLIEPLLFFGKAFRVEQRIGAFGLAAKDMHLNKINLGQRIANAGLAQPLLPTLKDERNFAMGVHGDQFVQA